MIGQTQSSHFSPFIAAYINNYFFNYGMPTTQSGAGADTSNAFLAKFWETVGLNRSHYDTMISVRQRQYSGD